MTRTSLKLKSLEETRILTTHVTMMYLYEQTSNQVSEIFCSLDAQMPWYPHDCHSE